MLLTRGVVAAAAVETRQAHRRCRPRRSSGSCSWRPMPAMHSLRGCPTAWHCVRWHAGRSNLWWQLDDGLISCACKAQTLAYLARAVTVCCWPLAGSWPKSTTTMRRVTKRPPSPAAKVKLCCQPELAPSRCWLSVPAPDFLL